MAPAKSSAKARSPVNRTLSLHGYYKGAQTGADADWTGSITAVAMALCGDASSRTCGRAAGDTACAQRTQDDAGEDRPQRRARDRPADAAGLVPPGALQVDRRAGDARAVTARKLVQVKLHDVEMSLHGILRGFGLKVGPTTPARFEGLRWLQSGGCRRG